MFCNQTLKEAEDVFVDFCSSVVAERRLRRVKQGYPE